MAARKWYLASSPWPERSWRGRQGGEGVGVAEHGRAAARRRPTRFLPSGRFTPVLPPMAASTMPRSVVGTCTTGTPRWYAAAANPATSVTSPPPTATTTSARVRPQRRPRAAQRFDRGQRLARLAVGDLEAPVLPAGIDRQLDAGLGDDGRPGGAGRQDAGQLGPDPGTDEHRVGAAAEGDLDR